MLCATIASVTIISTAIVHIDSAWSSGGDRPCSQKAPPTTAE